MKARAEQTQRVLDHFTALPIEEAAGIIAEQVQARSERLARNAARDALAEQSVTPSVERDIGPRLGM
ncbi:hypothetical protein [Gryllotalpicola sp.]|uniref:hypothetical protein n=1 Tax=Gryllotalpicola sp. TaxID=1932787 RepID=UPI002606E002|nr:hypothetical protein [Gryllotalpicola sp.]